MTARPVEVLDADVVVVGAGLAGLSAALRLRPRRVQPNRR